MRSHLLGASLLLVAACSGREFASSAGGADGVDSDAAGTGGDGASTGGSGTSTGATAGTGARTGAGGTRAGSGGSSGSSGGAGGGATSTGGAASGGDGGAGSADASTGTGGIGADASTGGFSSGAGGTSAGGASGGGAGGASTGGASGGGAGGTSSGGAGGGTGALTSCPSNPPDPGATCTGTFSCSYGSDPRVSCRVVYACSNGGFFAAQPSCVPAKDCFQDVTPAPFIGSPCTLVGDYCAWDSGLACSCVPCNTGACVDQGTWSCAPPAQSPCPIIPPNLGQPCEASSPTTCTYATCSVASYVVAQCANGVWSWHFPACN